MTIVAEPKSLQSVEGKYLTFRISNEEYGIEILKVREIVGLLEITAMPKTARHIKGVVNLRGKIIPVIDMRRKFGLDDAEVNRENCIITVMIESSGSQVLVGLLVDRVSEVIQLSQDDVDPVPDLGDMNLEFVTSLVKTRGRVIILLDIEKVIGNGDTEELRKIAQAAA